MYLWHLVNAGSRRDGGAEDADVPALQPGFQPYALIADVCAGRLLMLNDQQISNEDRQALIILIARKIHLRVLVHMNDAMELAKDIVAMFHPLP